MKLTNEEKISKTTKYENPINYHNPHAECLACAFSRDCILYFRWCAYDGEELTSDHKVDIKQLVEE